MPSFDKDNIIPPVQFEADPKAHHFGESPGIRIPSLVFGSDACEDAGPRIVCVRILFILIAFPHFLNPIDEVADILGFLAVLLSLHVGDELLHQFRIGIVIGDGV